MNCLNICAYDIQIKCMPASKPGRVSHISLMIPFTPFPKEVVLVISWNLFHVTAGELRFSVYYNQRVSQLFNQNFAFQMG